MKIDINKIASIIGWAKNNAKVINFEVLIFVRFVIKNSLLQFKLVFKLFRSLKWFLVLDMFWKYFKHSFFLSFRFSPLSLFRLNLTYYKKKNAIITFFGGWFLNVSKYFFSKLPNSYKTYFQGHPYLNSVIITKHKHKNTLFSSSYVSFSHLLFLR